MAPPSKNVSGPSSVGPSSSANGAAIGVGLSSSTGGSSGGGIGIGPLAGVPASVYPTDTIKDIAESIGINGMKDSVAAALAADVEYRIREIVQDAIKYMRHSKRDQLKTTDIDAALRARNIEPLYGFLPTFAGRLSGSSSHYTAGPTFRRVQSASGVPLHYVEDEEIDFDKILDAGPKIGIGRGVGWGAHWLAIEGVQPAVPQNPSPVARTTEASSSFGFLGPTQASASVTAARSVTVAGGDGQATAKPLVKHILSRELQLYYERLTKAILSPPPEADEDLEDGKPEERSIAPSNLQDGDVDMDTVDSQKDTTFTPPQPSISLDRPLKSFAQKGSGNHVRDAALASLRGDPGLHQLVPYLIQFVGSKVIEILRGGVADEAEEVDARTPATREGRRISVAENHLIGVLLNTLHAILVNPHIFIEPYLHQMMPSILSILLTSSLAQPELELDRFKADVEVRNPLVTAGPSSQSLRAHASALLTYIVETFGSSYPTLKPRIVATLLKALMAGAIPGRGDQEEAKGTSSQETYETDRARQGEPPASPSTKLGGLMALRRLGKASFRVLLSDATKLGSGADRGEGQQGCALQLLGNWMDAWEQGTSHSEQGQQEASGVRQGQLGSRKRQIQPLVNEVATALHALLPPFVAVDAQVKGTEQERLDTLRATVGHFWFHRVVQVDTRARVALETEFGMRSASLQHKHEP